MENLRLIITGHVDHGKSTLIGRLFFDTGAIREEKLEEIRRASKEAGREMEFAFFADHLREERMRGITIDTAQYRIPLGSREVTIIDAPGHREFLRNMLTGATQGDAAVLVIDAIEGIREQTRRHAYLLGLIGCPRLIVCVNKMDLADWREGTFTGVKQAITEFAEQAGLDICAVIPISAAKGEGIVAGTPATWHTGPTLLEAVASLPLAPPPAQADLLLPVQDVVEHDGKPLVLGTVVSGTLRRGASCRVAGRDGEAVVMALLDMAGDLPECAAGRAAALALDQPVHRGDVLHGTGIAVRHDTRIAATIFWLDDHPLDRAEGLRLECGTQSVPVQAIEIDQRIDSSTLETLDASGMLQPTEVGVARVTCTVPVTTAPFAECRELGRFALTRRGRTVAGGIVAGGEALVGR